MGENRERMEEVLTGGSIELVKELMSIADWLDPNTAPQRKKAADFLSGYHDWREENAVNRRAAAMEEGRSTVPEDLFYFLNEGGKTLATQIPYWLAGSALLKNATNAATATATARGTAAGKRTLDYGNRLGKINPQKIERGIEQFADVAGTAKTAYDDRKELELSDEMIDLVHLWNQYMQEKENNGF